MARGEVTQVSNNFIDFDNLTCNDSAATAGLQCYVHLTERKEKYQGNESMEAWRLTSPSTL